jgi:hypothetical protein
MLPDFSRLRPSRRSRNFVDGSAMDGDDHLAKVRCSLRDMSITCSSRTGKSTRWSPSTDLPSPPASVCGLGVCGRETLLGLSKQALELEYRTPFGVGTALVLMITVHPTATGRGVATEWAGWTPALNTMQEHDPRNLRVYAAL